MEQGMWRRFFLRRGKGVGILTVVMVVIGMPLSVQAQQLNALEQARRWHEVMMAVPILGKGNDGKAIGAVELPPPQKTSRQILREGFTVGQLTNDDYRLRGLFHDAGFSSRLMNLENTILAGEIINITLGHNVYGGPSTVVTALVNQSVYAAHGRKVIIPKGSKVIGKSMPVPDSLLQALIAAAGLGNDAEETTASPSSGFQGRIIINWNQIITPDGIQFGSSEDGTSIFVSQDITGRSGIPASYDPKELATFRATVSQIADLISVKLAWGQDSSTHSRQARIQAIQQIENFLHPRINAGFLPIIPEIFVRTGTRAIIRPSQNLWLPH